jgi:hypothetical protein
MRQVTDPERVERMCVARLLVGLRAAGSAGLSRRAMYRVLALSVRGMTDRADTRHRCFIFRRSFPATAYALAVARRNRYRLCVGGRAPKPPTETARGAALALQVRTVSTCCLLGGSAGRSWCYPLV